MLIPSDRPCYRVLDPSGFLGPDDHLYAEGDCIVFLGTPNEQMEPLNEPARKAQREYFEYLDDCARKAAEKFDRPFTGRARNLDEAIAIATQDARRVQLVAGDGGVPLMGARHNGPPKVEKLEVEDAPETGRKRSQPGKLTLAG